MDSLKSPLPNVLVTIDSICIVDVTGIKDPRLLWQALLATLWEHDCDRGNPNLRFYIASKSLSSEGLFSLCQNSGGSLKLSSGLLESGLVSGPPIYSKLPPWHGVPEIVATIFSSYEKKFVCTVHLAGADNIGIILDRIVKELQCHHYYLPYGGTRTTSEHQTECGPQEGPAGVFYNHFKKDIEPDGSLKLFVDAYQARTANRIIQQQPSIIDDYVAGQILPRIVVAVVARQKLVCNVILTGIDDPQSIRQRIIQALRFYGYLIRPDVVITQTDCSAEMTYEPLTDHGLFSLCRDKGDENGSLKLFVEASTVVHAYEYKHPTCNPLPKIVISILDWDNQRHYLNVNTTSLRSHDVYDDLRKQLETRTNMKLVRIYGPQPDSWFSWESDGLYRLIQEKGTPNGSLTLFVILQSVKSVNIGHPKKGEHQVSKNTRSRKVPRIFGRR